MWFTVKQLLFMLILCLTCFNTSSCLNETSDSSVVMKINRTRETLRQPKFDQRNNKVLDKESLKRPEYYEYTSEDLKIITAALGKLKNSDCIRDTKVVLEAISNEELWALQMFDSSPKFPTGILYGSHYQLGNFDECISSKQPVSAGDTHGITGQYCLADIERATTDEINVGVTKAYYEERPVLYRAKFNKTIHWAICIPSSCTLNDAEVFVTEIYQKYLDQDIVTVTVNENKCYHKKFIPISALEIIYGSIVGIIILFVVLATALHYWHLRQRQFLVTPSDKTNQKKQLSNLAEVIFCFSLMNTVSKLFNCTPTSLNLECIYGIKFISMCFIICGHALIFFAGGPVANTIFIEEGTREIQNGLFINNPLLVDSFLLISGFLMCRLLLIELEKRNGRLNYLVLYAVRYIRLTPSYLVVIGFYCTFLIRVGNGPLWNYRVTLEQERCLESWWTNLLYINNYVNTDQLCMFQSWYLAVDFHLYIIAPVLIYILWRWCKIGEIMLSVITFITILVPFWITFKDNLDPTLMAYPPEIWDLQLNSYFVNAYIKTHMRASSYCFGLLLGYVVHRLQKSGTKIPNYVIWLGWIISIICGTMAMFSVVVFYYPEHTKMAMESAIYASLHRVSWCICIGWVILMCITENASLVNKFLSWKVFIPLSRLTYSAYLINGFIAIYTTSTLQEPVHMSVYELGTRCVAHIVFTFTLAFGLCIVFESPIQSLEKILLRKDKHKAQKSIQSNGRTLEES